MCRGLTPRALMHFERAGKWKLTSLAGWARAGDSSPMESYDIRYAAPELLAADLRGVRLSLPSIQLFTRCTWV